MSWYGEREKRGFFLRYFARWNDANLREISLHIKRHMLFAHVRAATGTSVSRMNYHPYAYQN